MNRIIAATLVTLTAAPISFLFTQPARAERDRDRDRVCYPVTHRQVREDAADHPGAYRDGYREGTESARNGEPYEPRDAGGEFARGFEDGYYGRHFSGQQYVVRDRVEYHTFEDCRTRRRRDRDWDRNRNRNRDRDWERNRDRNRDRIWIPR